ncbi:hypothetical protein AMEX_G5834 [Astyanax mexicanus]|uniref:DUF4806 domain-containing protein n=1 Tax=Astyanax mexicanus TaxID=7994 RepID=A0A8T2M164_ASTMX|nr:hypothetical protein AMEX_G5834 [Astyanax mexicanus]
MFHIVEFRESSEVEVVPDSWVKNNSCLWPSYKSVGRIRQAICRQEIPGDSWKSFEIRVLCTEVTYQDARAKLPRAAVTSDLQSDENDDRPAYFKRKNRGSKMFISSGSEDELESPIFRKRRNVEVGASESSAPIPAAPSVPQPPPKIFRSTHSRENIGQQTRPASNFGMVDSDTSAILREILVSLETLKEQQKFLLAHVLKLGSGGPTNIPDVTDLGLPLASIQELKDLDEQIRVRPEQKNKLTTYLGFTGGVNTKEAVWRAMSTLLTNSLAKEINWSGANRKLAFKSLSIKGVVLNAVRKCPHARDATDKEVEQYIARWLQLAPDRDGGRKERAKSAASNTSFERE